MPELESKISAWRARLAAEFGDDPALLDELEAHLRDGLEGLIQKGVSADAAFHQMTARFGDARAVAGEFRLLQSPVPLALGRRGTTSLAYLAGVVGLAGFVYFSSASVFSIAKLGQVRSPLWPGFWLGMALTLTVICGLAVRASHRFLTRHSEADFRGVFAFNLLATWMLVSWAVTRLPLRYPANLITIHLLLGALLLIWRLHLRRKHPEQLTSP
jgi:hypothetical protein